METEIALHGASSYQNLAADIFCTLGYQTLVFVDFIAQESCGSGKNHKVQFT